MRISRKDFRRPGGPGSLPGGVRSTTTRIEIRATTGRFARDRARARGTAHRNRIRASRATPRRSVERPKSKEGYSRPETISFRRFKIWEKIFVRIWRYIAQDRRTRLRLTSERQLIKIFLSFLSPSCAIAQCVIVNRVGCINLKLAA